MFNTTIYTIFGQKSYFKGFLGVDGNGVFLMLKIRGCVGVAMLIVERGLGGFSVRVNGLGFVFLSAELSKVCTTAA